MANAGNGLKDIFNVTMSPILAFDRGDRGDICNERKNSQYIIMLVRKAKPQETILDQEKKNNLLPAPNASTREVKRISPSKSTRSTFLVRNAIIALCVNPRPEYWWM